MESTIYHIGCASGFSGDRLDAAEPVVNTLIANGKPAALIFETLGERTLALAHLAKQRDPQLGYEPKLRELLTPILAKCVRHGIPIIGNFGAANPIAAAQLVEQLGRESGLNSLSIAIIEGDDIRAQLTPERWQICEGDASLDANLNNLITANVYLGAAEIAQALSHEAEVVITGRVADPALALGPLIHYFSWPMDDWQRLAVGTLAGHLLECGSQISGGYFADPGLKDVPDPARIGFPIAEISDNGDIVITKAADSGGIVNARTVKEQLLYEIHDPAAYLTPDVVLDISGVTVTEISANRVLVRGARGTPRPETLKATLCLGGGWLGEGEISYAGPQALERAQLAANTLRQRLEILRLPVRMRIDLLGVASVHDSDDGVLQQQPPLYKPNDVRVRLAAAAIEKSAAEAAGREVLALYCDGPAGGGGVRWNLTQRIKTVSYLFPRDQISGQIRYFNALEAAL